MDKITHTPQQVETIVDQYRADFRSGQCPRLTDVLDRYPQLERAALLQELLPIELDQRRSAGEEPAVEDYCRDLPNDVATIRQVFTSLKTVNHSLDAVADTNKYSTQDSEAPADRLGDYEILERIGRGGMGVVYRARQTSLGRLVALKTIRATDVADTDEEVLRFRAEAEAAAALKHPGIVPVYQFGQADGQWFLSMELMEGGTLTGLLKNGPLEPQRAAALVRQIAEVVSAAHAEGVVHRDLKPANVLLDESGQPRVADFGLARRTTVDSGMTATGQILGTPSFMPPEQARGDMRSVGPLADVYSLGAILYCLLTTRPPFQGTSVMETLQQVLDREPASPSQFNPAVPKDLETICLKCLEKDPARRYLSAEFLAEELDRYLRGEPVLARPIGQPERVWRWCRRNPVISSLLALFLLAVGSGIAGTSWFALLMRSEAIRADLNAASANEFALRQQEARKAAEQQQYDALLSRTRLFIESAGDRPGWTWQALADLKTARALNVSRRDDRAIRTAALQTLNSLDVRRLGTLPLVHDTFAADITFSADGQTVYAAENKGIPSCFLLGFDCRTLEERERYALGTLNANYLSRLIRSESFQSGLRGIAVSSDGRWIAGGTRFGKVLIWDRQRPDQQPAILQAQGALAGRLAFAPDSKRLYSSSAAEDDHLAEIKVWQLEENWELLRTLTGRGSDFCLSHDGTRLGVCDGSASILETSSFAPLAQTDDKLRNPCFSSDDAFLVGAYEDRLGLYHSDTGLEIGHSRDSSIPEISGAHTGDEIRLLGSTLYCVSSAVNVEGVRIYDMVSQHRVAAVPSPGRTAPAFAVSPDGTRLAVAEPGRVALYEVRLPVIRATRPSRRTDIEDLAFSGDSRTLAVTRRNPQGLISRMQIDVVETDGLASAGVWSGRHASGTGDRTRPRPEARNTVAIDESGSTYVIAEPLLGLHVRDRQGNPGVPQGLPGVPHHAVVLPVGELIPAANRNSSDVRQLEVRIDNGIADQADRLNPDTGRFQVFVNISADQRVGPLAAIHQNMTHSREIAEWFHPARETHTLSCGFLGPNELKGQLTVTAFARSVLDGSKPRMDLRLDSILLAAKMDEGNPERITCPTHGPVAISAAGDQIWAVVNVDTLASWSWPGGELLYSYGDRLQEVLRGTSGIETIAVSPDLVAVGSRSGLVAVLESRTGRQSKAIEGPGGAIRRLRWLNADQLLVATDAGHLGTLDRQTAAYQTIHKFSTSLLTCAVDRMGQQLVSATSDGMIELYQRNNGQWLPWLQLGPFAESLADMELSPDGRWLTWALDGQLQTAHVLDLQLLRHTFDSLGL